MRLLKLLSLRRTVLVAFMAWSEDSPQMTGLLQASANYKTPKTKRIPKDPYASCNLTTHLETAWTCLSFAWPRSIAEPELLRRHTASPPTVLGK